MPDTAAIAGEAPSARASQAERLRAYLDALPAGARQLLAAKLEEARARGEEVPGGDMIIAALRAGLRGEAGGQAPRDRLAPRLLFKPLEPFLIDEPVTVRPRGRIPRVALGAIWTWIARDLKPREAAEFEAAAANPDTAQAHAAAFFAMVRPVIEQALDEAAAKEAARKRLAARLGEERMIDDLADALKVLVHHGQIVQLLAKAPAAIKNLADEGLANARAIFDPVASGRPDLLPFVLALFQTRLAHRAQLLRLAVAAVESDEPVKMAASPYRCIVELVLCDMERAVLKVADGLRERRIDRVAGPIKDFHDAARAMWTEMSLAGDGPWQRRLAKLRADLARLLTGEIDGIPGQIRRLLRPRQGEEPQLGPLTEDAVAEIEYRLDLLNVCRTHASEIALNELTPRIFGEVQAYLDPTLTKLIDNIRNDPDVDRSWKIAQIDAAIRIAARIFGQSYAQLLQKAAEVAINSARMAAR